MAVENPPSVVQAGREECRSGWMLGRVLISLHQSCPPISNAPFQSNETLRDRPGISRWNVLGRPQTSEHLLNLISSAFPASPSLACEHLVRLSCLSG